MDNDLRQCDSDSVAELFGGYAEGFDTIYSGCAKRSFLNRWINRVLRQSVYVRFGETARRIDSSEIQSVLDVGCGSGRYCVEFVPSANVSETRNAQYVNFRGRNPCCRWLGG